MTDRTDNSHPHDDRLASWFMQCNSIKLSKMWGSSLLGGAWGDFQKFRFRDIGLNLTHR